VIVRPTIYPRVAQYLLAAADAAATSHARFWLVPSGGARQIRVMQRRELLRLAGAAALSSAVAPAFLRGRYRLAAQSSAEYSARTIRLMQESPVVDMLCQFAFADERDEGTPRADRWIQNPSTFTAADFERFRGSGVKTLALGRGGDSYEGHLKFMAEWNGFIASRPEWFVRVDDVDDLRSARPDGRIGIMVTAQNADYFRTPADVVMFHRLGQRVAQLTYNFQNRIGAGFLEHHDGGLSVFGYQIVAEMQRVGMTVDLSHCADRTTLDAIAAATKPVVFTHGAARGLMPDYARCKSDEALTALARNGGVMGIAFIRFMIRAAAPVTVEHVVDHIDYVIKLVGPDHVGIGSDLDMAGLGTPIPKGNAPLTVSSQPNFERYKAYYASDGGVHVDGMNHPKRIFDLVEAMTKRRHSDETIRLVLGGNFIRAVGASWA
jgi:membrane dipeptidase